MNTLFNTLYLNWALRRRRVWGPLGAFLMGCNPSPLQVRALRATGVRLIVSLLSEGERPRYSQELLDTLGIELLRLPVPDGHAPKPADVKALGKRLTEWLDNHDNKVAGTYVHCAAGQGRTGTLMAMILVQLGVHPISAIVKVRVLNPKAIETRSQMNAIVNLAASRDGSPTMVLGKSLEA